MSTNQDLAGRVAVVTGASRNIGRAIAMTLAEAGAAVVVNGHSNRAAADAVVADIAGRGGKALAAMADVTDQAAVERMVAAAADRFGRIDILVNNAAGRPERKLDEMSLADWRGVLAVILDGAFLATKACLPHLKRSGAGAIINIGGVSGHVGTKHRERRQHQQTQQHRHHSSHKSPPVDNERVQHTLRARRWRESTVSYRPSRRTFSYTSAEDRRCGHA